MTESGGTVEPSQFERIEIVQRLIQAAREALPQASGDEATNLRRQLSELETYDRAWRRWFYGKHGRLDLIDENGDLLPLSGRDHG